MKKILIFLVFMFPVLLFSQTDDARLAYNDAMQDFNSNNYHDALRGFKKVTELAPEFAPSYRLIAICHEELGNYEQAISSYDRVLGFDGKQPDVHYNMAVLHYDNKNYTQAKASLHKAINLKPTYDKAKRLLSAIPDDQTKVSTIIDPTVKTSNTSTPKPTTISNKTTTVASSDKKLSQQALSWFNRGATYYNEKDYKNAASAFEKALAIEENAMILANLGRCQLHHNDLQNALSNLKRAVALDPESGMANFYLGKAYEQDGKKDLAERYIRYGEKYNFKDTGEQFNSVANNHFRKGNELYQTRRHAEAVQAYQKAIELNPKVAKYYYNLGIAYSDMGNPKQAVAALEKCLQLEPSNEKATVLAANVLFGAGQLESAGAYYQAAVDMGSKDGYVYHGLGNVYSLLGDIRKAAQYHRESVKLNPNVADFSFNAGISFYKLKHLPEAAEFFKQTIKTDPKHLKGYQNLFITLMDLFEFDQAEKYGLEMIAVDEDNAESYYLMGVMYDRKRDFKNKNEYMKIAQKLGYNVKKLPL